MRFDILTLFPAMCRAFTEESIIGRAVANGALEVSVRDIRDYTADKHRRVDDYPYGGGNGMILQVQPVESALQAVEQEAGKSHVVYLSPKGTPFTQKKAKELLNYPHITLLCGHYEGVDERIIDAFVDEEISLGDFVLTGGEMPALCVLDAVARMLPGVLSNEECFTDESIYSGLLEYPQYTRPEEYGGRRVPDVLLGGNHAEVDRWRREESLRVTAMRRPDLLKTAELTDADRAYLRRFAEAQKEK